MSASYESCSFCPQLCRHVCPVAVATGHEAATPAKMMAAVLLAQRGLIPPVDGARAAALCTGCGACERHCKYGIEVPALLAQARSTLASATQPGPLRAVEGMGELVAVHCDDRRWATALSETLGQPVAVLRTRDHLGQAALEQRAQAAPHLARLQATLAGRRAVSCCSRCIDVLEAAGTRWVRLDALAPPSWTGPVYHCHGHTAHPGEPVPGTPACCGAHGPLDRIHPELAADVARHAATAMPSEPVATPDAACRHALRRAGAELRDPIDLLLAVQAT